MGGTLPFPEMVAMTNKLGKCGLASVDALWFGYILCCCD